MAGPGFNAIPYHHGIKLFLHDSVNLFPRPVWVLEREGIQEQSCCVGSHIDIGHFEGAPEERVVETIEHLRHRLLTSLLVDVAQELSKIRKKNAGLENSLSLSLSPSASFSLSNTKQINNGADINYTCTFLNEWKSECSPCLGALTALYMRS